MSCCRAACVGDCTNASCSHLMLDLSNHLSAHRIVPVFAGCVCLHSSENTTFRLRSTFSMNYKLLDSWTYFCQFLCFVRLYFTNVLMIGPDRIERLVVYAYMSGLFIDNL